MRDFTDTDNGHVYRRAPFAGLTYQGRHDDPPSSFYPNDTQGHEVEPEERDDGIQRGIFWWGFSMLVAIAMVATAAVFWPAK